MFVTKFLPADFEVTLYNLAVALLPNEFSCYYKVTKLLELVHSLLQSSRDLYLCTEKLKVLSIFCEIAHL